MNDNRDLLSDEELKASKNLLSNEEIQQVLGKKFTMVIPPAEEVTVTTVEIERALGNNDLEKIMFNTNISEERQVELISEQVSIYIALRLGLPRENVSSITSHETLQEAVNQAMTNYLEAYVDYETFLGVFRIQRKDITLLRKCYISIILAMIYMTFSNFFPGICVGNTIIYAIGTVINIMMMLNMFRLSFKIWSLTLDEKNNQ
jgi:hypothetical protein